MTAVRSKPIAFLFPAFPVLHQTFVLWEVLALRGLGVAVEIYSLKKPRTRIQQPEAAPVAREVRYLPSLFSAALWRANFRLLRERPGRYCSAYRQLARHWWADRHAGRAWQRKRIGRNAPEREATLRELVQGRFNRHPFFFLLKSLALVPVAAYLGERLRAAGIERLHAHWASYPATVALVVRWLYGIPFSFAAHAYDIYMVPRLLRAKVNEARFVVTCARVNAEHLARLAGPGNHRILVNYHGVDLERFRPVERTASSGLPCIVTCGRLEQYKSHHVLLDACAAMKHPVRCIIVGEGPQRRRLERRAEKLGIRDRVELTGAVPQVELVRIYGRADIVVLASVVLERSGKRDVIPNVLAEAMAMGLPVVGTNISGVGELVVDGVTGRLVPPNDPQALAAVLDELLSDREQRERLGRAARAKVAAEFDRSRNVRALARLFLEEGARDAARLLEPSAVKAR